MTAAIHWLLRERKRRQRLLGLAGTPIAAPTDLSLSATSFQEDALAGSTVATITATSDEPGATYTYSLLDDAGGLFTVEGSLLKLATTLPSGEEIFLRDITIQGTLVETGGTYSETFTLSITPVDTTNDSGLTDAEGTLVPVGEFTIAPTVGGNSGALKFKGKNAGLAYFVYDIGAVVAAEKYTFSYIPYFSELSNTGKEAFVGFGFKSGDSFHLAGLKGDGATGLNKHKIYGTALTAGNYTSTGSGAVTHGTQAGPNWIQIEISEDGTTYTLRTSADGTTWADEFTAAAPDPFANTTTPATFGLAVYLESTDKGNFSLDVTQWAYVAPVVSRVETFDLSTATQSDFDIDPTAYDRIQVFIDGTTTAAAYGDASKDGGATLLSASATPTEWAYFGVSGTNVRSTRTKPSVIPSQAGTGAIKAFVEWTGWQAGTNLSVMSYGWDEGRAAAANEAAHWRLDTDAINFIRLLEVSAFTSGTVYIAKIKDASSAVVSALNFASVASPGTINVTGYDYLTFSALNISGGTSRLTYRFNDAANGYMDGFYDALAGGVSTGNLSASTRVAINGSADVTDTKHGLVRLSGLQSTLQSSTGLTNSSVVYAHLGQANKSTVTGVNFHSYFDSVSFTAGVVRGIAGTYQDRADITPVRGGTDATLDLDVTGKEEVRIASNNIALSASDTVELLLRRSGQGSFETTAADFNVCEMSDIAPAALSTRAGGPMNVAGSLIQGNTLVYGLRSGLPCVVIHYGVASTTSDVSIICSWYGNTEAVDRLQINPVGAATVGSGGELYAEANAWT